MDIFLGNVAAKGAVDVPVLDGAGGLTGETVRKTVHVEGNQVTRIHVPLSWDLAETVIAVTHPQGIWASHSDQPPAWVAAPDSPGMEALLAQSYGCPVGVPDGWDGPGIGTEVELTGLEVADADESEPPSDQPVEAAPDATEGEPVA